MPDLRVLCCGMLASSSMISASPAQPVSGLPHLWATPTTLLPPTCTGGGQPTLLSGCKPSLLPQCAALGQPAVLCTQHSKLWCDPGQADVIMASVGWSHSLVVRDNASHACVSWQPHIRHPDPLSGERGDSSTAHTVDNSEPHCKNLSCTDSSSSWTAHGACAFQCLHLPIRVQQVATGLEHGLMLDVQGGMWSVGQGKHGQLGLGATCTQSAQPCRVVLPGPSSVALHQVVCGFKHSCAVGQSGQLWTWGGGGLGALGHGITQDEHTPKVVQAFGGLNIRSAAAGGAHTLCVSEAGDVYVMGSGAQGQLGLGQAHPGCCTTPQLLDAVDETIMKACAGARHSLLLTASGTVLVFGSDACGQLGLGHGEAQWDPIPICLDFPCAPTLAGDASCRDIELSALETQCVNERQQVHACTLVSSYEQGLGHRLGQDQGQGRNQDQGQRQRPGRERGERQREQQGQEQEIGEAPSSTSLLRITGKRVKPSTDAHSLQANTSQVEQTTSQDLQAPTRQDLSVLGQMIGAKCEDIANGQQVLVMDIEAGGWHTVLLVDHHPRA